MKDETEPEWFVSEEYAQVERIPWHAAYGPLPELDEQPLPQDQ